jgi:hypothetical protein
MATKAQIIEQLNLSFDDNEEIVWQAVGYDDQLENMFGMSRERWNEFVDASERHTVIADELTDVILEHAGEYANE